MTTSIGFVIRGNENERRGTLVARGFAHRRHAERLFFESRHGEKRGPVVHECIACFRGR